MNIIQKAKETASSVLPVMAIVLLLGGTIVPIGFDLLLRFFVGGLLLIAGLTIFLLGLDVGVLPLGERGGAELVKKRNLPLLLASSFAIGFLVTAAEPDIQVLATQVQAIFPLVNKTLFIMMIATGVAFFMMAGLFRTIMHLSFKVMLAFSYILVFALAFFSQKNFIGIAFDSGGATTGPMTVPFIMALGIGVSSVRARHDDKSESDSDSFGLTGMASVGPLIAVLVYSLILSHHGNTTAILQNEKASEIAEGISAFTKIIPHFSKEAFVSLLPVLFLFFAFQFFLLKLPPRELIRMLIGFAYSYIGLVIFLVGVNGGFMDAGKMLGVILGQKAASGALWKILLVAIGFALGAVVVCAEPAVWVLTDQVESLSSGTIKRGALLIFLSVGAAISISLAMLRALFAFNLMYILIPGYALALLLMIFSPKLFTAIAFDSGGVASGPISATFVLSFALGASSSASGGSDAFGVIALIAMTPPIAIQVFGILFQLKKNKQKGETK